MPSKKQFKKKQYKSKMPVARKSIDNRQNKAIVNLSKKVKKIENDTELKHKDVLYANTDVIPATQVLWATHNYIAQGTSSITRLGNMIAPTSYQIRVRFRADNAQVTEDSRVRMIIFWDRQCNGADPDPTGVDGLLDDSVITNQIFAPRNYNTLERYKIVKDETFTLHPVLATTTVVATGVVSVVQRVSIQKTYFIKSSRLLKYSGNAGTVADLVSNALYVLFYSDIAGGTNPPEVDGGVRMYFKDA